MCVWVYIGFILCLFFEDLVWFLSGLFWLILVFVVGFMICSQLGLQLGLYWVSMWVDIGSVSVLLVFVGVYSGFILDLS